LNRLNKYEKSSDILRAVETNEPTIYEIWYKTGIRYQHIIKYLIYLVQQDLITYRTEDSSFRITPLGLQALDMYVKLDELLARKSLHRAIKGQNTFLHSHEF
jgi:predicted transcriptional regulator